VNNAHASEPPIQRIRKEIAQHLLRFHDREPVQIDLRLHPILPTAKLLQH